MNASSHNPSLKQPVTKRDHIRGRLDAEITLLEYGDFQCPHCAEAHQNLEVVESEMNGRICFVYRHFPLSTIHPRAVPAAEAAEAAGAQRRFWEMHDLLFETQYELEDEDLLAKAQDLGLDLDSFARELAEHRHIQRIQEDFQNGIRSGVNGTPTFFINGVRHNGGYDAESLIAGMLASANA